ncbi:hypothetical protein B0H19DRAFT_1236996 [Mycena capillaripes]|nr:hypothetical protein B0H19DRAFT_1236996 [Mycena capillaripes]
MSIPVPLSFLGSASFTQWHSTLTAVLGALNITKWWAGPQVSLAFKLRTATGEPQSIGTRFCRRILTLKPSIKFEYSLHPQGREGPLLTSATSHDVSPTRRGTQRDHRWEKEEDGLGMTLPWCGACTACPRTLYIAHIASQSSTCPSTGRWTTANWLVSNFIQRSYFVTARARHVKSGAILQMNEAKGGMGQWDDVVLFNSHVI